jgi:hypothetical protein
VASSCIAWIYLSWIHHFDWQEQIAAVSADAVEPDTKEPDAKEPDAMEPDAVEPNVVEPNAGPEV